jgi:hypothetical protein
VSDPIGVHETRVWAVPDGKGAWFLVRSHRWGASLEHRVDSTPLTEAEALAALRRERS